MQGLRTTIYQVPDLTAAKGWYHRAFGTPPYFDEAFYVGFNIKGYELGLLPSDTPAADKSDNVLSYWGTKDIQADYQHLIELGATPHEAPHKVGGPIEVASVRDPRGNVVGLIFNPVFKLEA